LYKEIVRRNPAESESHQAVFEVLDTIQPAFARTIGIRLQAVGQTA
jgi:hypothetical protein